MPDVIYLDNAATSWPKPPAVAERMSAFLASEAANPGRAGHRMALNAEIMLDSVRKLLADFIAGPGADPRRLIFTLNATDALNIALKGLLRQGDHVITSTLEHNSVSRPLQSLADAGFISLTRVPFSPSTGTIDPDDFQHAITPNTRLIALTHASNVLGTLQPIAAVGALARAHNVRFLVDASQTVGIVPLNVTPTYIDALAFPGHKALLGPTGTGALYVHTSLTPDDFQPFREGGTGGDSSSPTQPKEFPYLLEGGTPNTVGIAGLGAAVQFLINHNPAQTLAHERALIQQIIDMLKSNPKITLYGPPSSNNRVGTLSFNIEGYSPHEAAAILDHEFHIAVRAGLHCAPYAHKGVKTFPHGTIRVSPGPFTTSDHIQALLTALQQLST